jgi:hypothetical protein
VCQRRLDTGKDSFTGTNAALANTRLAVGTTTTGPHLTAPGSALSDDTDVNVANRSSGTVTFSGNLTGSSATSAITLTGNTNATIAFTGAVNLNSTNAATTAFAASGVARPCGCRRPARRI